MESEAHRPAAGDRACSSQTGHGDEAGGSAATPRSPEPMAHGATFELNAGELARAPERSAETAREPLQPNAIDPASERRELAQAGDLLAAIGHGDRRAFAEFYRLTSPRIFGLLIRMLGCPEQAREAMQDCYVRVWRRAETFRPMRGEPSAWLVSVARNRALDLLRARRSRTESTEVGDSELEELADAGAGPEHQLLFSDDCNRLDHCLRQLRPEMRRALMLAFFDGCSHNELAEVLGAPLGTVKSWVRRGLAQLRACLTE